MCHFTITIRSPFGPSINFRIAIDSALVTRTPNLDIMAALFNQFVKMLVMAVKDKVVTPEKAKAKNSTKAMSSLSTLLTVLSVPTGFGALCARWKPSRNCSSAETALCP